MTKKADVRVKKLEKARRSYKVISGLIGSEPPAENKACREIRSPDGQ